MPNNYSISRAFDYINLEKLPLVTGRPAHEWDLYIVKELIDNALDADDCLWEKNILKRPNISIDIEYKTFSDGTSKRRRLIVTVHNQALFPHLKIQEIFDPNWYTSSKSVIKGVHRGALGNALKTLLGIPYAVRKRAADDYNPDLRPLAITCSGVEYVIHYDVDLIQSTIDVVIDKKSNKDSDPEGTTIEVCLDHFGQEVSRSIEQIRDFAYQYHLCNPQAQFSWQVHIDDEEWHDHLLPFEEWHEKYGGPPHIQWYSNSFNELLNALYTEKFGKNAGGSLSVSEICKLFNESQDKNLIQNVEHSFGKDVITSEEFDLKAQNLFSVIMDNFPRFNPEDLGALGEDPVSKIVNAYFPTKGKILYSNIFAVSDGSNQTPFVLEACVTRLKKGDRKIWTAINYSPTYGDPFSGRLLSVPNKPNETVVGLREFMEAYGFMDTTPIFLFLHLICPNIVKTEFSKTEIEVLPFKKALVELLNQLLAQIKEIDYEAERQFEDKVNTALNEICNDIKPGERFVIEQILYKLRLVLSNDPSIKDKVTGPESLEKLRSLLLSNEIFKNILNQLVIQNTSRSITVPIHPNRDINVPLKHLSAQLLKQNRVGKILYIQTRELEPMIIENGWLCKLDMALLRNPPLEKDLEATISQCAERTSLPFVVLHDSDTVGKILINKVQKIFQRIDNNQNRYRVIDIGVHQSESFDEKTQPSHLVEMLPNQIFDLLITGLNTNNISYKTFPSDTIMSKDLHEKIAELLKNYLLEKAFYRFDIPKLVNEIDNYFQISTAISNQLMVRQIKEQLDQTTIVNKYDKIVSDISEDFFRRLLYEQEKDIHKFISKYFLDIKKDFSQNG